jgi:Protein of unknown function (DUF1064).
LNFRDISDMPPGMRRLYEQQIAQKEQATEAKKRLAELTQAAEGRKPKDNKYHAKPTDRTLPDGTVIKFDSKREAAYYDQLKALEMAGVVKDIRLQVQFLLKPAYTDGRTGERFRAINYLADFTYWQMEDGEWKFHIADSKGHITKEYALKKKIMADMGHYIEEV